MSEKRFVVGDRIRVVVEGEMTGITSDGTLTVQYRSDLGACETSVELEGTAVKVERVAPAEWPPRPGDLWCNHKGVSWFAIPTATGVRLISNRGVHFLPDDVLYARGPLTLMHREEQS